MGKKVFVFLLILFAVSTVFCNWNLEYSKEKMFGEKKWYVASSKVLPAKGHTFSQQDLATKMLITYDPKTKKHNVILYFPSYIILKGGVKYGNYYLYLTCVRWDNETEVLAMYGEALIDTIVFDDPEHIIKKMRSSKTMILELYLITGETAYFGFDLTGVSNAIDKLHAKYK